MKRIIYFCFIISFLILSCKDQGLNSLRKENSKQLATNGTKNIINLLSQPIGTQLVSSDGTPLLNRVMSVSDPMRDPDWDWTEDTIDTLYVTSYDEPKLIRRPYYGPSSIKPFFTGKNGSRDIWSDDGWEFLLRDFGTPQYSVSTPFFILYNKHLGILRYFFFGNLVSNQINHAVGKLLIKDSVHSPLFTLTDSTDQYINDYDVYEQHTVSKYYQDQWNVMDFRLVGFDPDIDSKYARFIIDVDAYKNFQLKGNANLTLNGTLGKGGSTHSQLLSFLSTGAKLYTDISKGYKDIKTAQENYEDMLGYANEHDDAWWSGILGTAASVGATSWIPALGPAVGIARFVLGGGSSQNRQPKPITLAGHLQLEGELFNTTDINSLEFIVPGAKVDDPVLAASYNELPIYNHKPGIFNLIDAPYVTANAWGYCNDDPGMPINSINTGFSKSSNKQLSSDVIIPFDKDRIKSLGFDVNPNRVLPPPEGGCEDFDLGVVEFTIAVDYNTNPAIFNNSDDIDVAFTFLNSPATAYANLNNGTATIALTFDNYNSWYSMANSATWLHYFHEVGIKADLFPKNAPSSVSPVTILKAYQPYYGTLTNEGLYY